MRKLDGSDSFHEVLREFAPKVAAILAELAMREEKEWAKPEAPEPPPMVPSPETIPPLPDLAGLHAKTFAKYPAIFVADTPRIGRS